MKGVIIIPALESSTKYGLNTSLDRKVEKIAGIMAVHPDDPTVMLFFAEYNFILGNRLDALMAYQKLLQVSPGDVSAHVTLARIFYSMGYFKEAFSELAELMDQDGASVLGHIFLARFDGLDEITGARPQIMDQIKTCECSYSDILKTEKMLGREQRIYRDLLEQFESMGNGEPVMEFFRGRFNSRIDEVDQILSEMDDLKSKMGIGEESDRLVDRILPDEDWGDLSVEEEIVPDIMAVLSEEMPETMQMESSEESVPVFSDEGSLSSVAEEEPVPEDSSTLPVEAADISDENHDFPGFGDFPEDSLAPVDLAEGDLLEYASGELGGAFDSGMPEGVTEPESVPEVTESAVAVEVIAEDLTEESVEPVEIIDSVETPEPIDSVEIPETTGVEEPPAEGYENIEAIPLDELYGVEANPLEESAEFELPGTKSGELNLYQARLNFYESVKPQVNEVLMAINRTRGVTASMVIDEMGQVLHSIGREDFDPHQLASELLHGLNPLISWKENGGGAEKDLVYWVIEFKNGLLVLQPVSQDLFLVVVGKTGANFGAVRYSIEKNSGQLSDLFADLPR